MFGNQSRKEVLNQIARKVLRAACASDAKTEQAVASPFLYAKIRARIEAEKSQASVAQALARAPSPTHPLLWTVGRRAVPALALIALLTLGSFWSFGTRSVAPPPPVSNMASASDPLNNQPALITTACSLTAKDQCAVSTSDVIAILMTTGEGKKK